MSEAERFAMMLPVYDTIADDAEMLASVEEMARTEMWRDCVARAGGETCGPPTSIERVENWHYGKPLVDEAGLPVYREDGEPLLDYIKFSLYLKGWAVRREE